MPIKSRFHGCGHVYKYIFAINDGEEMFSPIFVLPFLPTPVCPVVWATLITSFAYLALVRLCDFCQEESVDAEAWSPFV